MQRSSFGSSVMVSDGSRWKLTCFCQTPLSLPPPERLPLPRHSSLLYPAQHFWKNCWSGRGKEEFHRRPRLARSRLLHLPPVMILPPLVRPLNLALLHEMSLQQWKCPHCLRKNSPPPRPPPSMLHHSQGRHLLRHQKD